VTAQSGASERGVTPFLGRPGIMSTAPARWRGGERLGRSPTPAGSGRPELAPSRPHIHLNSQTKHLVLLANHSS
jgi:hypothetical protein